MKTSTEMSEIAQRINTALLGYSDKDWNYSRILLQTRPLAEIESPYVLGVEYAVTPDELKALKAEITWGCRHADELGMLEIISLRLNKALLGCTSDECWGGKRPVVRLQRRQDIEAEGIAEAFWYKIVEVAGEDFDNR